MTRKYELKRRAERLAETRKRIVEATVGLHTSVGPAQTTSLPSRSERECSATPSTPTSSTSASSSTRALRIGRRAIPSRTALAGRHRGPDAPPTGGSGRGLRVVRARRGRPGELQARLRGSRDDGRARRATGASGSSRSGRAGGRMVAAKGGAGGDRPRPRARDLALACTTARPDAQAGGRRNAAFRLQRLAFDPMATAEDRRLTDSGIEVKPVYTADDLPPGELELPGEYPVHARPLSDDVPRPPVDDPPVRGVRLGRGDERALPLSSSSGARPGSRSRSTCRRSSATTRTTRWPKARSVGPESRSTRSPTWSCCSTESRSPRSPPR